MRAPREVATDSRPDQIPCCDCSLIHDNYGRLSGICQFISVLRHRHSFASSDREREPILLRRPWTSGKRRESAWRGESPVEINRDPTGGIRSGDIQEPARRVSRVASGAIRENEEIILLAWFFHDIQSVFLARMCKDQRPGRTQFLQTTTRIRNADCSYGWERFEATLDPPFGRVRKIPQSSKVKARRRFRVFHTNSQPFVSLNNHERQRANDQLGGIFGGIGLHFQLADRHSVHRCNHSRRSLEANRFSIPRENTHRAWCAPRRKRELIGGISADVGLAFRQPIAGNQRRPAVGAGDGIMPRFLPRNPSRWR